jgi:hypothetical protein
MFPQQSPLLTKQGVEVSSKGENVILRIGNVDLPMHYEHALDVSRWIREEGQVAKSLTGRRRTMRSLGILEDAAAKPSALPPPAPGVAIHVKPKLQDYRREDVRLEGRLVAIKIGRHTMRIHFESALKIAQWLRLRAKEARNRAGDTRHWSAIGAADGSH